MNRIDRSNWQTRLVIALAIGLAAGPILYSSFRRELARWCFASSFEHQLEGDRPLALARLKRAVEWDPDNIELLMQLSILQQTPGLIDECVATRDKIVELAARQNTSHRTLLSQRMLISALNGRAYAHALSGKNLDQAAKDIEEAVNLSGPIESALRDTRGYIALLRDELDVAREDIEEALDQAKNDHKLRRYAATGSSTTPGPSSGSTAVSVPGRNPRRLLSPPRRIVRETGARRRRAARHRPGPETRIRSRPRGMVGLVRVAAYRPTITDPPQTWDAPID